MKPARRGTISKTEKQWAPDRLLWLYEIEEQTESGRWRSVGEGMISFPPGTEAAAVRQQIATFADCPLESVEVRR